MTIPASEIVAVNPAVSGSGGSPLTLAAVILTQNDLLPSDGVVGFGNNTAVKNYFGAASQEYELAQIYFLGSDNSTIKPGLLWFAPYNEVDRAAFLRSGSLAAIDLTTLQSYTGILTLSIDGTPFTSGSISLAAATSFSNAATLIEGGFVGGTLTVAWSAVNSTFVISSPTTGVTSTITFCTGSLSDDLNLTQATGAILSQGADADTPETAMDRVVAATQNWVDFTTTWEPDLDTKLEFAVWTNAQNQRYMYVAWDTDVQAITNGSLLSFGAVVNGLEYNGVVAVYNTVELGVFVLGAVACIDFSRTNGRITLAFKSQSGFVPTVTDAQIADNLLENGYSFYGSYATANDQFNFFYNGQMAGNWQWIDPFVNQVYINSQLQLALISLLTNIGSIPYNQGGYSLIRAAMTDPITQALNFGSIRVGVTLSEQQKALVNAAAGLDVSGLIENQGYYLQILDPGTQIRGERGTPVINFWYTDGGAVQKITVASIDIM